VMLLSLGFRCLQDEALVAMLEIPAAEAAAQAEMDKQEEL